MEECFSALPKETLIKAPALKGASSGMTQANLAAQRSKNVAHGVSRGYKV